VIQSVNRSRINSTDNGNNAAEVVQFLKDDHYFKDARHNGNTFLQVFRLDYTLLQPECELCTQYIESYTYQWLGGVTVKTRGHGFNARSGCYQVVTTWMGDVPTGKPSWSITNQSGQLSLPSVWGR